MRTEDVKRAATNAIERAMNRYGHGWKHISHDARFGAAMALAIADFRDFGPDKPASYVVSVAMSIHEQCHEVAHLADVVGSSSEKEPTEPEAEAETETEAKTETEPAAEAEHASIERVDETTIRIDQCEVNSDLPWNGSVFIRKVPGGDTFEFSLTVSNEEGEISKASSRHDAEHVIAVMSEPLESRLDEYSSGGFSVNTRHASQVLVHTDSFGFFIPKRLFHQVSEWVLGQPTASNGLLEQVKARHHRRMKDLEHSLGKLTFVQTIDSAVRLTDLVDDVRTIKNALEDAVRSVGEDLVTALGGEK